MEGLCIAFTINVIFIETYYDVYYNFKFDGAFVLGKALLLGNYCVSIEGGIRGTPSNFLTTRLYPT
jgi:hypothetical protein